MAQGQGDAGAASSSQASAVAYSLPVLLALAGLLPGEPSGLSPVSALPLPLQRLHGTATDEIQRDYWRVDDRLAVVSSIRDVAAQNAQLAGLQPEPLIPLNDQAAAYCRYVAGTAGDGSASILDAEATALADAYVHSAGEAAAHWGNAWTAEIDTAWGEARRYGGRAPRSGLCGEDSLSMVFAQRGIVVTPAELYWRVVRARTAVQGTVVPMARVTQVGAGASYVPLHTPATTNRDATDPWLRDDDIAHIAQHYRVRVVVFTLGAPLVFEPTTAGPPAPTVFLAHTDRGTHFIPLLAADGAAQLPPAPGTPDAHVALLEIEHTFRWGNDGVGGIDPEVKIDDVAPEDEAMLAAPILEAAEAALDEDAPTGPEASTLSPPNKRRRVRKQTVVEAGLVVISARGPSFVRDPEALHSAISNLSYFLQGNRHISQPGQFDGGQGGRFGGAASAGGDQVRTGVDAWIRELWHAAGLGTPPVIKSIWSPAYRAGKGWQKSHRDKITNNLRFVIGVTQTGAPRKVKLGQPNGIGSNAGQAPGIRSGEVEVPSGGHYVMGDVGSGARRCNGVCLQHEPMATDTNAVAIIVDLQCPYNEQESVLRSLRGAAEEVPQHIAPVVFDGLADAIEWDTKNRDPGSQWARISNLLYWKSVNDDTNPLIDVPGRSFEERIELGQLEARRIYCRKIGVPAVDLATMTPDQINQRAMHGASRAHCLKMGVTPAELKLMSVDEINQLSAKAARVLARRAQASLRGGRGQHGSGRIPFGFDADEDPPQTLSQWASMDPMNAELWAGQTAEYLRTLPTANMIGLGSQRAPSQVIDLLDRGGTESGAPSLTRAEALILDVLRLGAVLLIGSLATGGAAASGGQNQRGAADANGTDPKPARVKRVKGEREVAVRALRKRRIANLAKWRDCPDAGRLRMKPLCCRFCSSRYSNARTSKRPWYAHLAKCREAAADEVQLARTMGPVPRAVINKIVAVNGDVVDYKFDDPSDDDDAEGE